MGQAQVFMEEQQILPELLIKLAEGATIPSKANNTDTGYDLTAISIKYNEEYGFLEYGTGVFMQIPEGYEVKVFPRSSISKYDLYLANSTGIIDETYHREVFLRFKTTFDFDNGILTESNVFQVMREGIPFFVYPTIYNIGDKIAQFEMKKKDLYTVKQVDSIKDAKRQGFGSSGA